MSWDRCFMCGGEMTTAGYAHRLGCSWNSLATNPVPPIAPGVLERVADPWTLRDLFAAFVMCGMYASGRLGADDTKDVLAAEAYYVADAMVAAREPKP